jgi:hypothetical protein
MIRRLWKMIIRRDFVHAGIKYSFNWNQKNHHIFEDRTTGHQLFKYLTQISNNQVPHDLFNNVALQRISRFKITGGPRGMCSHFGQKLVEEGKIARLGANNDYSKLARKVIQNYRTSGFSNKPGHEPVLKYLLINHKNTIACEVPVWRLPPNSITGHIDLLLIADDDVIVVDYKPEGNFMRSLPQVAFYGYLLGKNLTLENVTCISFNEKEAWKYSPQILVDGLNVLLEKYQQVSIPWIPFIQN